ENAVSARVGVVATGASVELLEKLGLPVRRQASAMAPRCYVRSPLNLHEMVVPSDRAMFPALAWIFPLGHDESNVACGVLERSHGGDSTNLRHIFRKFMEGFPLAVELMCGGEAISPLQGARLRCGLQGVRHAGEGSLLAIGETIGATYPLTGEGVGKAMQTRELAAPGVNGALAADRTAPARALPARV